MDYLQLGGDCRRGSAHEVRTGPSSQIQGTEAGSDDDHYVHAGGRPFQKAQEDGRRDWDSNEVAGHVGICAAFRKQHWDHLQSEHATMGESPAAANSDLVHGPTSTVLIRASILAEVDAVYALAVAPADCYVGLLLPPNPACQECRAA